MKTYEVQVDATMPYVNLTQEEIEKDFEWWDDEVSAEVPPQFNSYQLFADGTLYGVKLGSDVAEFICDRNDVSQYGM